MVRRRTSVLSAVLIAVMVAIFYVVVPLRGDHATLGLAIMVTLLVVAVPVMWRLLLRVERSDRPVIEAVAYLSALVVISIVLPSAVYVVVADVDPGSFDGLATKVDGVYFTVTIVSTVGFGDIHPVSQGARALTAAHILTSLILLGTSIRLITRVAGRRVTDRFDQIEE